MIWLVAAAVVLVLLALAWWSSGRSKPGIDYQHRIDAGGGEAKSQAQIRRNEANGPRSL